VREKKQEMSMTEPYDRAIEKVDAAGRLGAQKSR
jgi:hypothetical protein